MKLEQLVLCLNAIRIVNFNNKLTDRIKSIHNHKAEKVTLRSLKMMNRNQSKPLTFKYCAGIGLSLGVTLTSGCISHFDTSGNLKGEIPENAMNKRPNVVLFFIDDMGYGDLSCFGNTNFTTPNLDKLATEGTRFTDFYVPQPVCGASRAGLMTGTYPNRIGMNGAPNHTARHGINRHEMTMAEMLQQKGYRTGMAGKWHLGHLPQFLPPNHGFDSFTGIPYSNDMSPSNPLVSSFYPKLPLYEDLTIAEFEPDQREFTQKFTKWGKDFITDNKDNPFFLYMAHPMPHTPIFTSSDFENATGKGLYADVITEIDWSVGEISRQLKALQLEENTIIMFASDNGPWLVFGDHAGSTGGLNGAKGNVYEGGVRIPFIAKWPGHIKAGAVCKTPAMTIDILPTLAWITGANLPAHPIDGKNIYPLLSEPETATPAHQVLYFYYRTNELQALRMGDWKMILPHTMRHDEVIANGGQHGKYSYIKKDYELYNLIEDPNEQSNLYGTLPTVEDQLFKLIEAARDDMGDSLKGRKGKNCRPHAVGNNNYSFTYSKLSTQPE